MEPNPYLTEEELAEQAELDAALANPAPFSYGVPAPQRAQTAPDAMLRGLGLDREAMAKTMDFARQRATQDRGMAQIQRGGNKLGAAIAGVRADTGHLDQMMARADQPIADEKENQAKAFTYAKLLAEGRQEEAQAFLKSQGNWEKGRADAAEAHAKGLSDKEKRRRELQDEAARRGYQSRENAESRRATLLAAGKRADAAAAIAADRAGAKADEKAKGLYLEGYEWDPAAMPKDQEIVALRKAQATANTVQETIRDIEALHKQFGTEALPTEAKARMRSLVTDLRLAMKGPEAYQLGVLAGPDMEILATVIPDPTDAKANVLSFLGGEQSMAKFKTLASQVQRRFDNSARSMGARRKGSGGPARPPPGSRDLPAPETKVIDGKTYFRNDAGNWAVQE